jgi:hypothetical protein
LGHVVSDLGFQDEQLCHPRKVADVAAGDIQPQELVIREGGQRSRGGVDLPVMVGHVVQEGADHERGHLSEGAGAVTRNRPRRSVVNPDAIRGQLRAARPQVMRPAAPAP